MQPDADKSSGHCEKHFAVWHFLLTGRNQWYKKITKITKDRRENHEICKCHRFSRKWNEFEKITAVRSYLQIYNCDIRFDATKSDAIDPKLRSSSIRLSRESDQIENFSSTELKSELRLEKVTSKVESEIRTKHENRKS